MDDYQCCVDMCGMQTVNLELNFLGHIKIH